MPELPVPQIVMVVFFLLVGFPVHEFAHAFVAYRLGDGTAKLFGRLTLNPAAHFDPLGAFMLVLSAFFSPFVIGWAKPTPVNPANLRDRRNGEVAVALAGPLSNLLMAAVGALIFRIAGPILGFALSGQVLTLFYFFVGFNVALAIFNLLPVPPLDGSTLLFRFLSPATAWRLRPILAQYGIFVLLAIIWFGGPILGGVISTVVRLLLGYL